jgi:hypothetical protein
VKPDFLFSAFSKRLDDEDRHAFVQLQLKCAPSFLNVLIAGTDEELAGELRDVARSQLLEKARAIRDELNELDLD